MNIADDKKLKVLLNEYRVANRARLRAYSKRSLLTNGRWYPKRGKVIPAATPEDLAEVEKTIQICRLFKLECSKRLRAYCKLRGYRIRWGSSNNIEEVLTKIGWQLRHSEGRKLADNLLTLMFKTKLTKRQYGVYMRRYQ